MRSILLAAALCASTLATAQAPGTRVLVDCHNCYPYKGQWSDRIDRALATGVPVAIEQDLTWYIGPDGKGRIVDSHEKKLTGKEPTLEDYFFKRIAPYVDKALQAGVRDNWPIITLNLDLKTEQPEMLQALWKLVESHRDWLAYAIKPSNPNAVTPIFNAGPVLILTGRSDAQEKVFYTDRPIGSKLYIFGAVHSDDDAVTAPPEVVMSENATAYRRWWNNPWKVIEGVQQPKTGEWTPALDARLKAFADLAHKKNLWLRFYTLDGGPPALFKQNGWFEDYNFGSLARAQVRWRAATLAGVDFIASDQMEELSKVVKSGGKYPAISPNNSGNPLIRTPHPGEYKVKYQ